MALECSGEDVKDPSINNTEPQIDKLNKCQVDIMLNMADVERMLENHTKAIEMYENVLKFHNDNENQITELGSSLEDKQNLEVK